MVRRYDATLYVVAGRNDATLHVVARGRASSEIPPPMRKIALSCLVASWRLAAVLPLAAQDASPYVPLQHWAMPYVEHLIAAGVITDPTPLTRPLKQSDVVRALQAVDTVAAAPAVRGTVRQLLSAFARSERGPWGRIDGALGVAAATYARRDPLAAIDTSGPRRAGPEHGYVSGGLALQLLFGPVVAVTHPYFDTRLKYDPDWYGKKDRKIAGRNAEAYVSAQWRYAELSFGILDRNWGPSGIQGILLSDSPYGFDHLGLWAGTSGVQLQAIATQLNDLVDSAGATEHRYMVQHRLWVRPPGRWTVALWEGSVASGVGRELEPWYLNIMNLGVLAQLNTGTNVNSFVGADFERQGATTVFGQFMLDDIQVDRKVPSDVKPTSYAFTVGAKGRGGPGAWTVFYTQVSNLAYRNEDNVQVPLYFGLGTGRNFDGYDQATAKLGLLARPGLLLEPELTLLRQGEGDPRLKHPAVPAYPTTATIFQGVVERTLRAAVAGNLALERGLGLRFDAGVHRSRNAGHVTGQTRTRFVGSVGLEYRFHREAALP